MAKNEFEDTYRKWLLLVNTLHELSGLTCKEVIECLPMAQKTRMMQIKLAESQKKECN